MRAWSCNSKPRIGLRLELHERLDTVGCFRDLLSCDGRLGLVEAVGEGTVGEKAAFCRPIPLSWVSLSWVWWCLMLCEVLTNLARVFDRGGGSSVVTCPSNVTSAKFDSRDAAARRGLKHGRDGAEEGPSGKTKSLQLGPCRVSSGGQEQALL